MTKLLRTTPLLVLLLSPLSQGCDGAEGDGDVVVLRSEFADAEVVTIESADGLRTTELIDANGDRVASVEEVDGSVMVRLRDAEASPAPWADVDDLAFAHAALHELWLRTRFPELPEGTSAATTCTRDGVPVSCYEPYCGEPMGSDPILPRYSSLAQCHAWRDQCGAEGAPTFYQVIELLPSMAQYLGPRVSFCLWWTGDDPAPF